MVIAQGWSSQRDSFVFARSTNSWILTLAGLGSNCPHSFFAIHFLALSLPFSMASVHRSRPTDNGGGLAGAGVVEVVAGVGEGDGGAVGDSTGVVADSAGAGDGTGVGEDSTGVVVDGAGVVEDGTEGVAGSTGVAEDGTGTAEDGAEVVEGSAGVDEDVADEDSAEVVEDGLGTPNGSAEVDEDDEAAIPLAGEAVCPSSGFGVLRKNFEMRLFRLGLSDMLIILLAPN
jgi:hypothetical protein